MKRFYAFGGFGLVLVLFAIWKIVDNFRFLARSVSAQGKLVKWDITAPGTVGGPSGTGGKRSYRPVVSFRASDGSERRVTGQVFLQSRRAPGPTGASYAVRYDASNPADARIVTFTQFWLFALLALAVGSACLAFAVQAWRDPSE